MKKQAQRTVNVIDRERELLKEAGYKMKIVKPLFPGDETLFWYEKKIGKYLSYYADPVENTWEVCIITPSLEVHTLKKFKNITDMIASSDKAFFKI
jgi:hypothetical protein